MSYDKNSSLDHALELAKKRFGQNTTNRGRSGAQIYKTQIEEDMVHKYKI